MEEVPLNPLTYLFPVLAAVFVLACFVFGMRGPLLDGDHKRSRVGKPEVPASVAPRLWARPWAILALTAVYALIAFLNLGNTASPESWYAFQTGESVTFTFDAEEPLDRIFFFCGLNTGEYSVKVTDNDVVTGTGVMEQGYNDIFKWRDAELTYDGALWARSVTLTADSELELAEVAFYRTDGTQIKADTITVSPGAGALLDEQDLVPEAMTFSNSTYFDEIYHARTALEHMRGMWPYEISHPPLGKLILSIGIAIFGLNPFGWRFMGTLFGALMLPILWAFLRRMFRDDRIALCGTAIFAFDFMHFAQTRIATIDTYGVFFILLMYLFFWNWMESGKGRDFALSGVFFGLGAASKWICLYAGAGLGVLWVLNWISAGRKAKKEQTSNAFWPGFAKNILQGIVWFVLVPAVIYYVSYTPYGTAEGLSAPGMYFSREYAKIVWDNQTFMFTYHAGLVAEHPYSSQWWQWLFDIRPILYYLDYGNDTVTNIAAFTSPLLTWAGLISLLYLGWRWARCGDRRAMFIVVGYLAQLLPWVFITRLTFAYHYFPSTVFLLLALCAVFDEMRRRGHLKWMYAFTAASLLLFALYYPALTGVEVSRNYSWKILKWFPSWPL